MPSNRNNDQSLRDVFEDILRTNEWANEYNYMIDVYRAIRDHYMPLSANVGLTDDLKGWQKLFENYSKGGSMSLIEFNNLINFQGRPAFIND
jgi:hypothetical protein